MICDGNAWVVTKFPNGTEVHAHPNHEPDDIKRAWALGYPNVSAMTLDHDPLHMRLSWLLVHRDSHVLRRLGLGEPADKRLAAAEEELVLAAQKYMNEVRRVEKEQPGSESDPQEAED